MPGKNRFTAILTFFLAFIFTCNCFAQNENAAQSKSSDYCKLLEPSENNSPKTFRTKALLTYTTAVLVDGGDSYFYLPKCNNEDYFALANFSKLADSDKKWESFFKNLPVEKDFIFEVDFTGTARSSLLPIFGHLGWSRSEITPIKINSIRDVSKRVKKPDYDAEAPIVGLGRSLRDINVDALFSILLGSRYEPKLGVNISENFVLTDFAGKNFTKKQLPDFLTENPYGKKDDYPSLSINGDEATKINDQYKVTGLITYTDNQDKITKIGDENLFDYKNENWLLIKSRLSIL